MAWKVLLAIAAVLTLVAVIGRICMNGLRRFIRTLWPHS
jgi:hypothetical protein